MAEIISFPRPLPQVIIQPANQCAAEYSTGFLVWVAYPDNSKRHSEWVPNHSSALRAALDRLERFGGILRDLSDPLIGFSTTDPGDAA